MTISELEASGFEVLGTTDRHVCVSYRHLAEKDVGYEDLLEIAETAEELLDAALVSLEIREQHNFLLFILRWKNT